jgi:hypothetical protein
VNTDDPLYKPLANDRGRLGRSSAVDVDLYRGVYKSIKSGRTEQDFSKTTFGVNVAMVRPACITWSRAHGVQKNI